MSTNDETYLKQLGSRIKLAREKLGLSQREFALRIGTTQNIVSRYENGLQAMRITEIPLIAEVLEVDEAYFFIKKDTNMDEISELLTYLTDSGKAILREWLTWQVAHQEKVAIAAWELQETYGGTENNYLLVKNPLEEGVQLEEAINEAKRHFGEQNLIHIKTLMNILLRNSDKGLEKFFTAYNDTDPSFAKKTALKLNVSERTQNLSAEDEQLLLLFSHGMPLDEIARKLNLRLPAVVIRLKLILNTRK